jgi:uncharacterized protein YdeI (YjbR/CyaY-like superfamily)
MRLIQAFLLLALLPVKLFAQTETPMNLTEGILAFSCVSEKEEVTLVLLDEQSEWRTLGAIEGAVVTEIDDGFRFEDPDQVGWIAYLQQDRQSYWTLNYLDEDGSDSFVCVNENDLVQVLAEAIASKVLENGEMLAERNFMLEQELENLKTALADGQLRASEMVLQAELVDVSSINAYLDEVLSMNTNDRSQAINRSALNDVPSGSLRTCVLSLRVSPARFTDECRAEVSEYLLKAN